MKLHTLQAELDVARNYQGNDIVVLIKVGGQDRLYKVDKVVRTSTDFPVRGTETVILECS